MQRITGNIRQIRGTKHGGVGSGGEMLKNTGTVIGSLFSGFTATVRGLVTGDLGGSYRKGLYKGLGATDEHVEAISQYRKDPGGVIPQPRTIAEKRAKTIAWQSNQPFTFPGDIVTPGRTVPRDVTKAGMARLAQQKIRAGSGMGTEAFQTAFSRRQAGMAIGAGLTYTGMAIGATTISESMFGDMDFTTKATFGVATAMGMRKWGGTRAGGLKALGTGAGVAFGLSPIL